eukprot:gnl/TRDRNA2_/TRDRNA2_200946_c0_seq1.p2 gnl/TRDRNA2_/TRDRNA2_200946_c0~~gnl/TRDRNA2_/TRDRNA2_200946_c0_seq1.p2  ORF type:complete len:309 (+),score=67.83 gnl/TRDRNA2_/TRDRNA2_200946_c0_seq1:297-1223(+)
MADTAAGCLQIDNSQWDADCDAAFEMALPPRWEFRDRAWGAPGVWRAFPEGVSNEINALARRGQRRGNISLGGCELIVDLQEMTAMPTDQYAVPRMLRKSIRQPRVNKRNLKAMYLKYAEPIAPADHPGGPDGITGEKFLALFKDLAVDPAADVAALAIASACNASEMGIFRRREFVCGCAAFEVDNVDAWRDKIPEVRQDVLSGRSLEEVYKYTFGVAVEPPCKVLPLEEAEQYWALLLHDWPLRELFCTWAARHMKGKAINRDLWLMVLKFAQEVPPDLSNYDDNPAWPVVFDEFVEYCRSTKGLS